jgi:hypothetical protein
VDSDKLQEILVTHEQWLNDDEGGERANLQWADLLGADLREANLRGANLLGADLREADLRGANLRWADLRVADLRGANLRGADLREANLRGANLRWVDLLGADLRGADLRVANLRGANLQWADLLGADLRVADLRGADLDFSVWPLWCGSKNVKADNRLVYQLVAHICGLDCNTPEFKEIREFLLPYAKQSHRADDLGLGELNER